MRDVLNNLIAMYPTLVAAARTNSPKKAIRLFCLECYGGSKKSVRDCEDKICPLWPYRFGTGCEDHGLPIPEKKQLDQEQIAMLKQRIQDARTRRWLTDDEEIEEEDIDE